MDFKVDVDFIEDPSSVWELNSTVRGEFIEEILAVSYYDDDEWWQIADGGNGDVYFPVIDFVSTTGEVVSLKTIDPRTYTTAALTYLVELQIKNLTDRDIYYDGTYIPMENRYLHLVYPAGTNDMFNWEAIGRLAEAKGIQIIRQEL